VVEGLLLLWGLSVDVFLDHFDDLPVLLARDLQVQVVDGHKDLAVLANLRHLLGGVLLIRRDHDLFLAVELLELFLPQRNHGALLNLLVILLYYVLQQFFRNRFKLAGLFKILCIEQFL
jgi:hypothetical protein